MTRKSKLILLSVCAVVLLLALGGVLTACSNTDKLNLKDVTVNQVGKEQRVKVQWSLDGHPSKIIITVEKSNGIVDSTTTITNATLLAKGYATIDASYGINSVRVEASNKKYSDKKTVEARVFTDEYVIAPLVATMPVTLFSLQLKEITNNFTIPTFVWLQRGMAWNYNEMPQNVNLIPMATFDVLAGYLGTNYWQMYTETSKWVGELYEMNNNSKFHFYVNDYHPFAWMQCTYVNQIPTKNYDVTLLTDGTASNAVFESLYIKDSAETDYNKMVSDYNQYKQYLWDKNNPDSYNIANVLRENDKTRNWILPMLTQESNVRLVLTRDFFNSGNNADTHEAIKTIVNNLKEQKKIEVVSLYGYKRDDAGVVIGETGLLGALNAEEKAKLKKLYNLGDNLFEKAVTENKKALVILGTRTTSETDFDDFVAATMAHFGNSYVYYYKGHPWTPTVSDPAKAKRLEELGLIDIDSSIAAELIFYFNPEVVATGYGSSTYKSLPDSQVGGTWNRTVEDTLKNDSEFVKFVLNKKALGDSSYGSIAKTGDMVFEFINNDKYDVGVYNAKTGKIKYYKANGNDYTEVK